MNKCENKERKKERNEGWMTLWKRWTFQGVGVCVCHDFGQFLPDNALYCMNKSNCVEYVESSYTQNKSNLETKITSIQTRL